MKERKRGGAEHHGGIFYSDAIANPGLMRGHGTWAMTVFPDSVKRRIGENTIQLIGGFRPVLR